MPDRKQRSSFLLLLLLFVGVAVIAAGVVALVPVKVCEVCKGDGSIVYTEEGGLSEIECPLCGGDPSLTLLDIWSSDKKVIWLTD